MGKIPWYLVMWLNIYTYACIDINRKMKTCSDWVKVSQILGVLKLGGHKLLFLSVKNLTSLSTRIGKISLCY